MWDSSNKVNFRWPVDADLTYCGFMMQYGEMNMNQHWIR